VLSLLHGEVAQFLRRPETTERLFKAGVDVVANTRKNSPR